MPGTDQDLVSRLLKQSILALCREAVSYTSRLEVDGIVCVTLDDSTDHVVKIHELFCKREPESASPATSLAPEPKPAIRRVDTDREPTIRQPVIHLSPDFVPLKQFEVKVEPVPVVTSAGTSQHSPRNTPSPVQVTAVPVTVSAAPRRPDASHPSQPARAPTVTDQLVLSQARNITCKKCNCIIDNAKDFENHNTDAHGYYTCMVCLATFTSRNNMKRHLRLHTGVKPYTCSTCQESFARNDDYKRHLLRHSFDKPFRCTVCKSGYSDRSCVKNHMLKEHGAKVFHICPQCGASFINPQKYLIHKKTHPEFQDYRCELCSFTGSNSLMYNKHMLTHGSPKRYICGHCEVSFNDPFTYTNHMKRHKGDELVQTYICCFCDHVAPTFEQFQRHEHSHIQSKQHACAVCKKQFRYPSNLREHMLTHMPKSALTLATVTASPANSGQENRPTCSTTSEEQLERTEKAAVAAFSDLSCRSSLKLATNGTEHEFIGDEENADMETGDNAGSDYWCTECNQGFGTEDRLQDHILHTHEDVNEIPGSPVEHAEAELHDNMNDRRTNDSVSPRETTPVGRLGTDPSEENGENPYELNTQIDSPSDSLYEEETCSNPVRGPTNHKQGQQMDVYEEQTQMDTPRPSSRQHHGVSLKSRDIAMMAKRSRAYDEETVIDEDAGTRYQDDVMKEADNTDTAEKSPVKFSTVEMAIVEDAMKEVQKIQARFRIKQSTGVSVAGATSLSDNSPLRLALNGGKDTAFKSPAGGVWKHASSVNRNRPWPPTRHDINRNNIPASALVPEDLSVARGKTARFENSESKSPEQSFAPKTDAVSADLTSAATPYHYSKTSVLGMDTDFSATPNRGSPTTLNLQLKSPGFEKVVTPAVLFKERAPFTCEVCDRSFEEFEGAEGFDQHGISVHRRYICSWCGKPFTSRPNRERHVRYHTGEKPYKCDVCPASFFRGDDLKYHRTTKHADIRPFLCGTCKAGFALPKELERHLRTYPEHRVPEQT